MDINFFVKQVNRLVVEYGDKGFTMSKERYQQWFEFMNQFTEKVFERAINECLKTQYTAPTMADVMKYVDTRYSNMRI